MGQVPCPIKVTRDLALIVIGYSLQKQRFWDKSLAPFYLGFILFSNAYVIIHVPHGYIYDNYALTHVLLYLAFILAMVHMKWEEKHIVLFAYSSVMLIILISIRWNYVGFPL